MASVDTNSFDISYLTGNDTFLDWVNHYNTYSIEKLNNLRIYTGFSGDGINVITGSTGSMQVNLADIIPIGITFSEDVSILGDLTYDWDSVSLGGIKQRVFPQGGYTGISGGFTFGQVVRIGASGGDTEYFLARSDDKDLAEAIGIVSDRVLGSTGPYSVNDTYLEITTHGVVEGDFRNATVDGRGLTYGCVYFLSPGISGGLTNVEPSISGQVSKPILVGITADKAMVLNYRGQYLQGSGTGGTGGIDNNKKIISLDGSGSGLTAGYCIGWSALRDWHVVTSNDAENILVGLCTTTEFELDSNYYAEITTSGFIDDMPGVTEQGKQYVGADGLPSTTMYDDAPSIGFAWADGGGGFQGLVGIDGGGGSMFGGRSVLADGVTYGTAINDNLLINGAFDIWQRSIGVDSVYGSTGSTHFADRWVRVDGTTGSSYGTHSIQRNTFAPNQTEVFGNPKYYATLQNTMSGGTTAEYIHIENRIEDVRTLRNEEATLSFWARAGSGGMTMDIAVTQYSGEPPVPSIVRSSTTYPASFGLGTLWAFYEAVIDVPAFTDTPTDGNYLGVGFRTENITSTYDIAKVKLERGDISTINVDSNETEELNKCKRYYQRTYDIDESTHSITMLDNNTPSISSMDFVITPDKDVYHKFDVPMRETPTLTLYSPSTGYTGDGFNRTANKDLRNTSGTYGWNSMPRIAPAGSSTIGVDYSNSYGVYITVPAGTVVFDNVSVHYVADADLNLNM
jgi:hypothetical protein